MIEARIPRKIFEQGGFQSKKNRQEIGLVTSQRIFAKFFLQHWAGDVSGTLCKIILATLGG